MKRKWFILFFVAWFAWVGGSEKPKALLRFHVQTTERAPKETLIPIHLSDPPSVFYIHKKPDLDEHDMQAVQLIDDGGVLVIFNEEGRQKLENLTRENMGSFLVVICNGKVIYSPMIDMALVNGRFVIPEGITPDEVGNINQAIQGASAAPLSAPRLHRRIK